MNYLETKLDEVWRYIVKAPGKCLFCPERQNLEAHHIFGGRWRSVWFFRWTPIFGVPLCVEHHKAAHHNKQEFWLKLEVALEGEERWSVICRYRESKVIIPEQPDLKILLADLKKQAAVIEETNYMDLEVDGEYRGRDADGNEYPF
ncbi:MAG: hypothetical protein PHH26_00570 [Candidatus Thermoplasmatota archaeon]|nr:hypothetical protein [Candidatus Thermoplasmatota archaeon]